MNWPLADPRGRVHPPVTLPYQQRKNEPIFLEQSNSSYLLRSDSGVAISPSILHVFFRNRALACFSLRRKQFTTQS